MSRDLSRLTTDMQINAEALLALAANEPMNILIYCTERSFTEQARLYRNGRPLVRILAKAEELSNRWGRPDLATALIDVGPQHGGTILTWAGPGQSAHNYGVAWDAVPMRHGRPVWGATEPEDAALWARYGRLVRTVGCGWAGDWADKKRELPHAQLARFDWREWIR